MIDNDPRAAGSFTTTTEKGAMYGLALGSRFDATTQYFRGQIAGLEIYHGQDNANALPPCVLKLIVENQIIPTSLYIIRTFSFHPRPR